MTGAVMRDYYEVLGLRSSARAEEIKQAYRRLARRFHPDVTGGHDGSRFCEVRKAYETLSDETLRRRYDERLEAEREAARRLRQREREWFADEIAVDFPSISALVDRIREGFLDSDRASAWLSAEILLSEREAADGVVVPFDVPVRVTCPFCGGRGETWMEFCGGCGGSGESLFHHPVSLALPSGVSNGARFRFSVETPYAPSTRIEVRVAIRQASAR
jgi:molecular chaperone DnaJ